MKYRLLCLVLGLGLITTTVLVFAHEKTGWVAPEEAKKIKNPIKITKELIRKGKEIYEKKCALCHGDKGDGKGPTATGLNPKPTNFREHHGMEMTDGELFWKIMTGRGPMPSFKKDLSEEEIWHVINFINTLGGSK
jgi:mono/diheme cytochrome c family protein